MLARWLAITVPCVPDRHHQQEAQRRPDEETERPPKVWRGVMRVRVRKSFKVVLGVRVLANAKGTRVVLGGKGYIALVLHALVLTACGGGRPSPSPIGTPPLSPSPISTAWACVTSSPTGT